MPLLFFLEMYPDHEIYFLARDGEYLYDLTRLLEHQTKTPSKRIHLINISRNNMISKNITEYIEQNGIRINNNSINQKRFLLVDTAFIGQIIDKVKSIVSPEVSELIDGHLLVSTGRYLDLNIYSASVNSQLENDNIYQKEHEVEKSEHLY